MKIKSIACVALLKDGEELYGQSVFKDEHSLLVSYDMIPLRGLEECKKHLISKGLIPTKCLVYATEGEQFDFWTCTISGQLSLHMMDWGVHKQSKERVLSSMAFYFSDERNGEIEEADRTIFSKYFWFVAGGSHKDGRRRTTWAKLQGQLAELCTKYDIQPVKVLVVPDDIPF